jgi:hypothetical protein
MIIEDQAMIRLFAHSPHSRQQVVSLSQSSCVSPVELTDGKEGCGHVVKSYYRDKAWSSINHSLLSDSKHGNLVGKFAQGPLPPPPRRPPPLHQFYLKKFCLLVDDKVKLFSFDVITGQSGAVKLANIFLRKVN